MQTLPYLTAELPGIGGRIKQSVEDFRVEEIPLYAPCGRGTHTYFKVTKRGVPTQTAIERISRFMGVRTMDVGVAGLKDAQAITTQTMSIEYADGRRLERFRDADIQVSGVTWHNNKLRTGHLAGNRFTIRIRDVGMQALPAARAVLDALVGRGVPNYFGEQRFGARGDTGRLGEAMVRGDLNEFIALYLGRPSPEDPPETRAARAAFDAGDLQKAMQLWPRHYNDQRRALAAYRKKHRPAAALVGIDQRIRRLYISAFQSEIFNEVLARRIQTLDQVWAGDMAEKIDSGGVFYVEDEAVDQPRAQRFEISPTGPIVGTRSNFAKGRPGQIEQDVLARRRIAPDDFERIGSLKVKGGRRALRFRLGEPALSAGKDKQGDYVEISFIAPAGCYATIVLREIMKLDSQTQD